MADMDGQAVSIGENTMTADQSPPTLREALHGVWASGWTPATLRSALAALRTCLAEQGASTSAAERALASELLRWHEFLLDTDPVVFVEWMVHGRPLSLSAPHWDWLDAMLVRVSGSTPDLIFQLVQRGTNPAQVLTAFLDEVAPRGVAWDEVSPEERHEVAAHRHAYEALLELGTMESLTWALNRLDLFDWEAERDLRPLIQARREMVQAVVVKLWPRAAWATRAEILMLLCVCGLFDSQIVAKVIDTDEAAMSVEDLTSYVEALANLDPPTVVPRVRDLLDHAFERFAAAPSPENERVIAAAVRALSQLDDRPTDAQLARGEALRIRLLIPSEDGGRPFPYAHRIGVGVGQGDAEESGRVNERHTTASPPDNEPNEPPVRCGSENALPSS